MSTLKNLGVPLPCIPSSPPRPFLSPFPSHHASAPGITARFPDRSPEVPVQAGGRDPFPLPPNNRPSGRPTSPLPRRSGGWVCPALGSLVSPLASPLVRGSAEALWTGMSPFAAKSRGPAHLSRETPRLSHCAEQLARDDA